MSESAAELWSRRLEQDRNYCSELGNRNSLVARRDGLYRPQACKCRDDRKNVDTVIVETIKGNFSQLGGHSEGCAMINHSIGVSSIFYHIACAD